MQIGGDTSSWLLLAGVAILIWVLLRRVYHRKSRQRPGWVPAQNVNFSRQSMHEMLRESPLDMSRWQVEMYDFARDMQADLDTKMHDFQQLTIMAEGQTKQLEEAITKAERLGLSSGRDTLEEIKQATLRPVTEDQLSADQPLPLGSLPVLPSESGGQPLANDALRSQIYALSDDGLGAVSISRHIGIPVGEVEMVLNLRSSAA